MCKKQIIMISANLEVLRMTLIGIVPSWVEEKKITVNQDYVEADPACGRYACSFPRH